MSQYPQDVGLYKYVALTLNDFPPLYLNLPIYRPTRTTTVSLKIGKNDKSHCQKAQRVSILNKYVTLSGCHKKKHDSDSPDTSLIPSFENLLPPLVKQPVLVDDELIIQPEWKTQCVHACMYACAYVSVCVSVRQIIFK